MPQWLRCGVGLLRSAGPARPATGLARCASPEGLPEVGPGLRQGHSSPGELALKSSECKLALLRANYVLAPYGADAPSLLACRAAARTRVCASPLVLEASPGRRLASGAPPPVTLTRTPGAGTPARPGGARSIWGASILAPASLEALRRRASSPWSSPRLCVSARDRGPFSKTPSA